MRLLASTYVRSTFCAHYCAYLKPLVKNIVSMICEISALPIKQPRSIFTSENGSSDRPRYSRDAGFIVTKTPANGDTFAIGIEMSVSVRYSFYSSTS